MNTDEGAEKGQKRGQAELEEAKLFGSVRWFNAKKGFGFIGPATGKEEQTKDVFFHRKQLVAVEDEEGLEPGVVVTYLMGKIDGGRSCAVSVQLKSADEEAKAKARKVEKGESGEAESADDDQDMQESDDEEGSEVEVDLFDELVSGVASEKGPTKDVIEDYSVNKVKLPISVLGEEATCVFYAVFDGHGGSSCAEYASAHLAKNILSRLRDRTRVGSGEAFLKAGIMNGFKQTEHNFVQHARRIEDRAGSTACTMIVYGPDEESRLRLYMANVGDSRAVLGRLGGDAVRLTEDHKPNLPEEKKRIEANGGGVAEISGVWRCMLPRNRICPIVGLAVSRALGDKDFKNPDIVSAKPEIFIHEVDWEEDEFVILASDGIWDVVSDREAVLLVQQAFKDGHDEEKAAQLLIAKALEKGTHDDRTALVVRFGWCKGSAAYRREKTVAAAGGDEEAAAQAAPSDGQVEQGVHEAPLSLEEEDEENDPEVAAAIRAALGDDDDEGEGEEEELMVVDEAVEGISGSGGASSSTTDPTASSSGPATAASRSGAASSSAPIAGGASGSGSSAADTAVEPPEPAGLAGVAGFFEGAAPGGDDSSDEDHRVMAAAAEFFGPGAASFLAGAEEGSPLVGDNAEVDLDDIFAGGDHGDDRRAEAAAGQVLPRPGGPGAAAVGMGLFDMDLPAPAEEQGPSMVGPRRA